MQLRVERASESSTNPSLGKRERWASGLGGGILLAVGARLIPRILSGAGLAAAGSYLLYRGLTGYKSPMQNRRLRVMPDSAFTHEHEASEENTEQDEVTDSGKADEDPVPGRGGMRFARLVPGQ